MNKETVLDFIDRQIDYIIEEWKIEIKQMKEGGCGTLLINQSNPFKYEEDKIQEMEDIRKYIKENLK